MARSGDSVRGHGSHVHEDGTAKISYEKKEAAAHMADMLWSITGKPYNAYPCAQKPEHYHVGRGWPK